MAFNRCRRLRLDIPLLMSRALTVSLSIISTAMGNQKITIAKFTVYNMQAYLLPFRLATRNGMFQPLLNFPDLGLPLAETNLGRFGSVSERSPETESSPTDKESVSNIVEVLEDDVSAAIIKCSYHYSHRYYLCYSMHYSTVCTYIKSLYMIIKTTPIFLQSTISLYTAWPGPA